jgi:hypothetical protein
MHVRSTLQTRMHVFSMLQTRMHVCSTLQTRMHVFSTLKNMFMYMYICMWYIDAHTCYQRVITVVCGRERFSVQEMVSAVAVCAGLVLFAFADMSSDNKVMYMCLCIYKHLHIMQRLTCTHMYVCSSLYVSS